jgi:hypothetical protein
MNHVRRGDHLDQDQVAQVIDVVEQALAPAEQRRDEMKLHLVDQTCVQVLLRGRAPPASATSFPPAPRLACSSTLSIPSVTNVLKNLPATPPNGLRNYRKEARYESRGPIR